jgi:hypothetical protein
VPSGPCSSVTDGTGRIDVTVGNLHDHPSLAKGTSYGSRVAALLRRGPATTPEISEHLYGAEDPAQKRVRALLSDMAKKHLIVNLEQGTGRGHVGRWGLLDEHRESADLKRRYPQES